MDDHYGMVLGVGQGISKDFYGRRGVVSRQEVVWKSELSVIHDLGDLVVLSRVRRFTTVSANTDWYITSAVESIYTVDIGGCKFVIFSDRHGKEFAFTAGFQGVDDT